MIYLGELDNGVIIAGCVGSALNAGVFIAIGSCISAITNTQVTAFVGSFLECLFFNAGKFNIEADYLGKILANFVIDIIQSFSFLTNFDVIIKGLIDPQKCNLKIIALILIFEKLLKLNN